MTRPFAPSPALRDAVGDCQRVFRRAMEAMASPGKIVALEVQLSPPAPLLPATAALLLTLCDFETPLWLDSPLAESAEVVAFLRFHTGAALAEPGACAFAAVADPLRMPALSCFSQGAPEYPDRSATIILQLNALEARGWMLEGPGIRQTARLTGAPLPAYFAQQLRHNRSRFPCGVDLFLVADGSLAALPRSLRLTETA
jgi:alpha-D-ribose 1-methylphosphonate 5-triphosphate synthase subunit PhnH